MFPGSMKDLWDWQLAWPWHRGHMTIMITTTEFHRCQLHSNHFLKVLLVYSRSMRQCHTNEMRKGKADAVAGHMWVFDMDNPLHTKHFFVSTLGDFAMTVAVRCIGNILATKVQH